MKIQDYITISATKWTWLVALFFGLISFSCGGGASQADAGAGEEATEEVAEESGDDLLNFDPEELKAKFTFDEGTGWYYHNTWNQKYPKRRTVTAQVKSGGYYILSSNYYGDNTISHNRIRVKIGDQNMTSERAPRDDRDVKKESGKRYEVNRYQKYGDKGIFEAIAKSAEGEKIEITFDGPDRTSKGEVSDLDRRAIRECLQLSYLLRSEAAQGQ